MTTEKTIDTAALCEQYQMNTYSRTATLVRGRGSRVFGPQGNQYLDFTSGISVLALGHAHPAVVEAIKNQAETLVHASNLFYTPPVGLLAEKLSKIGLGGKVFLCNSGAEANEAMIKLARLWGSQHGGRYEIVCMRQSFHGRTIATLSATGQSKVQKGFDPLMPGFVFAEFNNLDSVRSAITDKTVGILFECVQAEGGVIPATQEFMDGVRALCDEKGLLMMLDEIQCGMGRTGTLFGFEHYNVKPDLCSLAKAIGGGLPLGALLATPALSEVFTPGSHGSTFGGNPVACAAGLAVLRVMEEEHIVEHAAKYGELFRKGLEQFVEQYDDVLEVRGMGLLLGLVLKEPRAKDVQDELRAGGLLACVAGPNVVRFLPPLNLTDGDLEEALEMIGDALDIVFGGEEENA